MMLTQVIDDYQQQPQAQQWADSTARTNQTALDFWQRQLGNMPVDEITPGAIIEQRDTELITLSNATRNRYVAVLSGCLSYAVESELLNANPCFSVKKLDEGAAHRHELTLDEEQQLLKYLWINDRPLYELIAFALWTGAAKAEILALTWADFDLSHRLCTFAESERKVPIGEKILDLLTHISNRKEQATLKPTDTVFEDYTRHQWQNAVDRSASPNIKLRDLRHTFIMRRLRLGHSMPIVARYVGGKGLVKDNRYTDLTYADVRALAE